MAHSDEHSMGNTPSVTFKQTRHDPDDLWGIFRIGNGSFGDLMTCDSQDRWAACYALYKKNDSTISKLQQQLRHHLSSTLQPYELADALRYCQDRVTIFRYLVEAHGDYEETYQRLLDTTHWRLGAGIDQLTWRSFPSWVEPGFAFYHKYDRWGQPVLMIRLRYFSMTLLQQERSNLEPYLCYMMELARRWTYDETCRKQDDSLIQPLVLQISVVVDLIDAPSLPIDKSIIGLLSHLVKSRYPAMVDRVYVLNFGWWHQGVWQVLKLLLSDAAKSRIAFTTQAQLLQYIAKEHLLKEVGGSDDYEWNVYSNSVIQAFDARLQDDMVSTGLPEMETSKITLADRTYEDDIDNGSSDDNVGIKSLGSKQYGIGLGRHLGLRMGSPFLSPYHWTASTNQRNSNSSSNAKVENVETHVILNDWHVLSAENEQGTLDGEKTEAMVSTLADDDGHCYSLWSKAFAWLVLYVFLRIPFESLLYRHLIPIVDPQHVLSATIGGTAGMAMVIGTLLHALDF